MAIKVMLLSSLLGSPWMSLGTQLRIQEAQLVQLAFLDLICVGFHLFHVPVDAQKPTLEEISLWSIQPKRNAARECLCILRKRREGVNDRATIISSNDAGMDGEGADVGVF